MNQSKCDFFFFIAMLKLVNGLFLKLYLFTLTFTTCDSEIESFFFSSVSFIVSPVWF